MSLEALITDLTAAIRENTAALGGAPAKAAKGGKAAADKAPAAAPAAAAAAAPDAAPEAAVKAAAAKLMAVAQKNGREAAVALLAQFGVSKVTEIPAASLPKFVAAATAALAPAPEEAAGSDLI